MESTAINFSGPGPRMDFSRRVTGFGATIQNALINTITEVGSDPLFPGKGTTLVRRAARGEVLNSSMADHAANFAAMDTLLLDREMSLPGDPDALAGYRLRVAGFENQRMILDAVFTSAGGETRGEEAAL